MKIAIVEDEILTAMFIQETILDLNYEVVGIFDSHDAISNFLQTDKTDLVLMDIKINGKEDGIKSACTLKQKYPDLQTIFITSFTDSQTIQRAKKVSPLGYITKPINETHIEATLMVADNYINKKSSECLNSVDISPYRYNFKHQELYHDDKLIKLTENEISCIELLIYNKNYFVNQEIIIQKIWGLEDNRISSLRELIYRLRKKIPFIEIQNISKKGYMLSCSE
ncbi:response regulator [Sulfurimonas sp.]